MSDSSRGNKPPAQSPWLNRRKFLSLAALSATGLASLTYLKTSNESRRGRLIMTYELRPAKPELPAGYDTQAVAKNGVVMMDLDSGVLRSFETPFDIHYIETSKDDPSFAIGANKYGRNFAQFNLKNPALLATHQIDADLSFMGHFALSADRKILCATAVDSTGNVILSFDPTNLQILKRIKVGNSNPAPHDLHFLPDSRTLLTTSSQELTYIDFDSGAILRRKVGDLSTDLAIRHFGVSREGRVAIQANLMKDLDKPFWKYGKGEIVTADHTADSRPNIVRTFRPPHDWVPAFDHELLDFAFSNDGAVFGATMNRQPLVSFWDFRTGRLIRTVEIPGANRIGLTYNQSHFVVFSRFGVRYISVKTLEHDRTMDQFDDEVMALFPKSTNPAFGHKSLLEPT